MHCIDNPVWTAIITSSIKEWTETGCHLFNCFADQHANQYHEFKISSIQCRTLHQENFVSLVYDTAENY